MTTTVANLAHCSPIWIDLRDHKGKEVWGKEKMEETRKMGRDEGSKVAVQTLTPLNVVHWSTRLYTVLVSIWI